MPHSKIISPIHFVFSTQQRLPFITSDIERDVYRLLSAQARKLGCKVLAIGGMPDHIHIAVLFPATMTYADCAHQFKGATSRILKQHYLMPDDYFYWQRGYGVFGFSRNQIPKVVAYINGQKQHHANNSLWPALEAFDDSKPASPSSEEDIEQIKPSG